MLVDLKTGIDLAAEDLRRRRERVMHYWPTKYLQEFRKVIDSEQDFMQTKRFREALEKEVLRSPATSLTDPVITVATITRIATWRRPRVGASNSWDSLILRMYDTELLSIKGVGQKYLCSLIANPYADWVLLISHLMEDPEKVYADYRATKGLGYYPPLPRDVLTNVRAWASDFYIGPAADRHYDINQEYQVELSAEFKQKLAQQDAELRKLFDDES